MQIFTYLGFTLLSIFIQFVVMDFIQGRLKHEENTNYLRGSSQRKRFQDVLKEITLKPHALYYQTLRSNLSKNPTPGKLISNSSLIQLQTTTEIPTTVFVDFVYEDNSSISTEEAYTTESFYTTTELENITEIPLFGTKNESTIKPTTVPKKAVVKECDCNLLYGICDTNCCCDDECLDSQLKLFPMCGHEVDNDIIRKSYSQDICESHLPNLGFGNGLFCIVKSNLPKERNTLYSKIDIPSTNNYLIWKSVKKSQEIYDYSNKIYKYGDPMWAMKNGSIYHIDLPAAMINNYCSSRKPMRFLKDEKYNCIVTIQDLEMLQISKSLEEATVISATAQSMNSSVLNCTNLHCVNWTILACNTSSCMNYTKDLHEPACTESICANLALKIRYTFYYYDSKITNATVQYYMQNVTIDVPYLTQTIQVNYLLSNESMNRIITLSGNPGYNDGLPIIVSYAEKNFTDTFFNVTDNMKTYLELPGDPNGLCMTSGLTDNAVLFGINTRTKCRYNHQLIKTLNSTDMCKNIQNNIDSLWNTFKARVSPLGNPKDVDDKDWLILEKSSLFEDYLYGKLFENGKFSCMNLVTRYSLVFNYVETNGAKRILSCKFTTTPVNLTLNLDDVATIITIDINFVDVTKPGFIAYTPSHHLNLHLPEDFFYPFRSRAVSHENKFLLLIMHCVTILLLV